MWLFFAIITTLIWGFAELFYKRGANEAEKYSHLKICECVGAVMGVHAVLNLLFSDIGFDPVNLILYLPVSACYILSMALSFFGMRFIMESISDPIENTSGAICTLLCVIFLGQTISVPTVLAILLILAGILGIGFLERKGIHERGAKIGKKTAIIAFLMPFCYAILDALGSFLDVYYLETSTSPLRGVSEANIEDVANTCYELTFLLLAVVIFVFLRIKRVKFEVKSNFDKGLAAVFETAGQLTYVFAMSDSNGSIAAPIISSVCVVSLLLSRIFLKEKLSKLQYLFISIVILGIILIGITVGD